MEPDHARRNVRHSDGIPETILRKGKFFLCVFSFFFLWGGGGGGGAVGGGGNQDTTQKHN